MFKRKCPNCEKKVSRNFDFCPYCSIPLKDKKDYGLLGKHDGLENGFERIMSKPLGISDSIIDKMLGGAMRMLRKELEEMSRETVRTRPARKTKFQLYINGRKIPISEDMYENSPQQNTKRQRLRENKKSEISEETIAKAANLPRKETQTRLTRTANKIIYELNAPGLESLDNILINKLEESLEIKIYTNKAVYYKNLPIKLPLARYYTKEQKLFLEFKAQ